MFDTGLTYTNVKIHSPKSVNANTQKRSSNGKEKYLNVSSEGEYTVRLVSGYIPFLGRWVNGQGFKISPKTLLMQIEKVDQNGNKFFDNLYHKDNGTPYTEDECFCPLSKNGERLQTKYAANVIFRNATNDSEPVPVRIMVGPFDVFKHFMYFSAPAPHNYAPSDLYQGHDFKIITIKDENNKTTYMVKDLGSSPLTPQEIEAVSNPRSKEHPNGIWKLAEEYHPYKCSPKMTIDNGFNPRFREAVGDNNSDNGQAESVQLTAPQIPKTAPPQFGLQGAPVAPAFTQGGPVPSYQQPPVVQQPPQYVPQQPVQVSQPIQQAPQPVYQQPVQPVPPQYQQVPQGYANGGAPIAHAVGTVTQTAPMPSPSEIQAKVLEELSRA